MVSRCTLGRSLFRLLEDIATEFDIQGLELDWTCVCIDANLRVQDNGIIIPVAFRGNNGKRLTTLPAGNS